jgi:hypothetical protein
VDDVLDTSLDLDSFDVIVASGLVEVVADYERVLDALLGSRAPLVLLHRQALSDAATEIATADAYRGQTTHKVTLGRAELDAIARRHGRHAVREFHVAGASFSVALVGSAP